MADFTGFNPTQASTDFSAMHELLAVTNKSLDDAFNVITLFMKDVWASPKAKEFASTYVPELDELTATFASTANAIQKNVARAIETMARANGSTAWVEAEDIYTYHQFDFFKEEKDGIVGMNVAQVELYLEEFQTKLKTFYENFAQVEALDIALYDPNGSLKAAFKTMLTQFETQLNETVAAVEKALKLAMLTEVNEIRMAKQNAADTMAA